MQKYTVAILIPEDVAERITELKIKFSAIADKFQAHNSKPVITLFSFEADTIKLKNFSQRIEKICRNIVAFKISLDGFDEFYQNKTVYIKPDEIGSRQITAIRKKFSLELKESKYDEEVNFDAGKTPHVTVAGNLNEKQHSIANRFFHNEQFKDCFLCETITLRMLEHEGRGTFYTDIKSFRLLPQEATLF